MKKDLKDLKKYLFPSVYNCILMSCTIPILIPALFFSPSPDYRFLPLLILCYIGICYTELRQIYKLTIFIKTHRNDPCMKDIIKDFKFGTKKGSDCLHLGDKYIIGHQGVIPIRYNETLRIYEHINRYESRSLISRRYIYATTVHGEQPLARMPYPRLSEDEFFRLFKIAKSKNPKIRWVIMKRKFFSGDPTYEFFM